MPTLSRLALFFALAIPISGCDQVNDLIGKKEEKSEKKKSKKDDDEEEDDDDDKKGSSSASASATASAAPSAAPTADASASASASGEAAPSASGSAPAAPTATNLPGHSPVPTTAEWEAASEVTVTNSSKLGCETKAVREWVRVTCKRINDSSGKPDFVGVYKGNEKNEVFTFVPIGAPHLASLVFPFQAGTDLEAKFGWDDGQKAKFTSQWPVGAPKPPAYGKFDVTATAVATPTAKKDPPKVEPPKVEPPKKDPPKVEPPKPPIKKERIPKK